MIPKEVVYIFMKHEVNRDRNLQTASCGLPKGQVLNTPHGFVTPVQNY